MSVNQAFVTTLVTNIKAEMYAVSDFYVKRANNGLESHKVAKDVIRLNNLLKLLEVYDVTQDYFDNDYLLKIQSEYSNHCGYFKSTTIGFTTTAEDVAETLTTYDKEEVYIHYSGSTISTDGGATGATLDKTPQLALDVYIDGVPMMIGDASKTLDVYFSSDGGTTAKAIVSLELGDEMYYNAVIIGTPLLTSSPIRFEIL